MNSRYRFANERFLTGQLDWLSDAFKVLLVDKTYTVQTDVHHTLADVPVSARVAASPALTGKSATDGVARADDAGLLAAADADLVVTTLDDVDTSVLSEGRLRHDHDRDG